MGTTQTAKRKKVEGFALDNPNEFNERLVRGYRREFTRREIEREKWDRVQQGIKEAEALQKQMEALQREAIKRLTTSDADIQAAFEKQFLPEFPTEDPVETTLRHGFSAERFNRALSTLSQYGPEEGLRRLKESDPEVAKYISENIKAPK